MFSRFLATSAAALSIAIGAPAFAQSAAAPAAAPEAPAAPAAPAAQAAPPAVAAADVSEGKVAFYGRKFAGRKTASGERFDPRALTMAHNSLPFGTLVKVTHLGNKRSVVVRVNDRGPSTPDRIGDLSQAAASRLKMLRSGVAEVKLEVVGTRKAKARKQA